MNPEKRKYNYMEPVLQKIHKKYISLPNKDVKKNTGVLMQVTKFCKSQGKRPALY